MPNQCHPMFVNGHHDDEKERKKIKLFERICFWHKSSPQHKEIHQQLLHSPVLTELKII